MLSQRTTMILVAVVTAVWAVNFTAGLVMTTYDADQAINGIFMAIVGGALALGQRKPPSNPGGGDPK